VGTYKMHFATGAYFSSTARESFYPFAEVSLSYTVFLFVNTKIFSAALIYSES
jgi:hypothetical protein